jgi:hypothetical protein
VDVTVLSAVFAAVEVLVVPDMLAAPDTPVAAASPVVPDMPVAPGTLVVAALLTDDASLAVTVALDPVHDAAHRRRTRAEPPRGERPAPA